jgi:hypothetical protein
VLSSYAIGGNGVGGGGMYSAWGKSKTQAYCDAAMIGFCCSVIQLNQTALISLTQLKH